MPALIKCFYLKIIIFDCYTCMNININIDINISISVNMTLDRLQIDLLKAFLVCKFAYGEVGNNFFLQNFEVISSFFFFETKVGRLINTL